MKISTNYEERTREILLPCLCWLSVLVAAWGVVSRVPVAKAVWRRFSKGEVTINHAAYLSKLDELHAKSFPEGNVAMRFDGMTSERDGWFIFENRYRLAYNLYPRMVYAAKEGVRLQNSADVLANNDLSDDWLRAHGVEKVFCFKVKNGVKSVYIRDLREEGIK